MYTFKGSAADIGLDIDDAVSSVSTNPVENQAVTLQIDKQSRVRPEDYVIEASGNTGTDDIAWNAALSKFSSQGYAGTLWLKGRVRLNAAKSWGTMVPTIRGFSPSDGIEVTSSSAQIKTTDWQMISNSAGAAITPTAAGDVSIDSAVQSLSKGDWVLLGSDDAIPGVPPHFGATGTQRAGEMHQIAYKGTGDTYYLNDYIRDPLTTSPKVYLIPIYKRPGLNVSDAVFADFTIYQSTPVEVGLLFNLFNLNGVRFENVHWEMNALTGGPGYMQFRNCANVRVQGCTVDGLEGTDGGADGVGYWVVVAAANGVTVNDNCVRQCRHAFTTTGCYTTGLIRYGTPLGIRVINNRFFALHDQGTTLTLLDTHPEGHSITFDANDLYLPDQAVSYGINIRSRKAVVQNNRIFGPDGAVVGIRSQCSGTVIKGNLINGCWIGVRISGHKDGVDIDDVVVENNTIRSAYSNGHGVETSGGTDIRIVGNQFIDTVKGIVVTGAVNNPASDWLISGNTFKGMSSGTVGVIEFQDIGAASASEIDIVNNSFVDCVGSLVVDLGTGDNIKVSGIMQENCSASKPYVKFTGGTGHAVRQSDLGARANTSSVEIGAAMGSANITVRGNTMDGYGSAVLGIAGPNASYVETAELDYNISDP